MSEMQTPVPSASEGVGILDVVADIKQVYENAIKSGTLLNLIRSQGLIQKLHEGVKREFVNLGVAPELISPHPGISKPEVSVEGYLNPKQQDIVIFTQDAPGVITEKIIAVNVRSQLSSLGNNLDTLYERTYAESLNLHLKYPRMCLGEVFMIPTHQYDAKAAQKGIVDFKKVTKLEDYIQRFQQINNGGNAGRKRKLEDVFKYERVCLLVVDFCETEPKIYSSDQELLEAGFVSQPVNMEHLAFRNFAQDLLEVHKQRFATVDLGL